MAKFSKNDYINAIVLGKYIQGVDPSINDGRQKQLDVQTTGWNVSSAGGTDEEAAKSLQNSINEMLQAIQEQVELDPPDQTYSIDLDEINNMYENFRMCDCSEVTFLVVDDKEKPDESVVLCSNCFTELERYASTIEEDEDDE